MKIRQALKIRDKLGTLNYRRGTIVVACRTLRRHKHRAARHSGIKVLDRVQIMTDTGYDEEGVPVSLLRDSRGCVVEIDGFPQVYCNTWVGRQVVGIPVEYLKRVD